ncbi:MAG: DUF4394 domain-containing protein [Verrucomicrobiota bacterium]|nr:DUF4394 domain-containing protein [Verrucomicrobiota bacterium]
MVDRRRVVSDANQDLLINVTTGATTMDGAIAYAAVDPNAAVIQRWSARPPQTALPERAQLSFIPSSGPRVSTR